jgi:hypothetical protein
MPFKPLATGVDHAKRIKQNGGAALFQGAGGGPPYNTDIEKERK